MFRQRQDRNFTYSRLIHFGILAFPKFSPNDGAARCGAASGQRATDRKLSGGRTKARAGRAPVLFRLSSDSSGSRGLPSSVWARSWAFFGIHRVPGYVELQSVFGWSRQFLLAAMFRYKLHEERHTHGRAGGLEGLVLPGSYDAEKERERHTRETDVIISRRGPEPFCTVMQPSSFPILSLRVALRTRSCVCDADHLRYPGKERAINSDRASLPR